VSSEAGRAPVVVSLAERRKNIEIISNLRHLLLEAESGSLVGILVAAHYGGDEMAYMGSGSLCDTPMLGVAAAQHLRNKLLR